VKDGIHVHLIYTLAEELINTDQNMVVAEIGEKFSVNEQCRNMIKI
jgi:hypothetical protein